MHLVHVSSLSHESRLYDEPRKSIRQLTFFLNFKFDSWKREDLNLECLYYKKDNIN